MMDRAERARIRAGHDLCPDSTLRRKREVALLDTCDELETENLALLAVAEAAADVNRAVHGESPNVRGQSPLEALRDALAALNGDPTGDDQ